MLDKDLREFIEEGLVIYAATRNERLEPNGARVTAVKVDPGGTHLIAFVPVVSASAVLQDLQSNGQMALLFTRPTDDRGCQVKGVFAGVREATAEERVLVDTQWESIRNTLEAVGVPHAATDAWVTWPCVAVRMQVNAVFDQTPGPGAGKPLS